MIFFNVLDHLLNINQIIYNHYHTHCHRDSVEVEIFQLGYMALWSEIRSVKLCECDSHRTYNYANFAELAECSVTEALKISADIFRVNYKPAVKVLCSVASATTVLYCTTLCIYPVIYVHQCVKYPVHMVVDKNISQFCNIQIVMQINVVA